MTANDHNCSWDCCHQAFQDAANSGVIISLIDENRRLQKALEASNNQWAPKSRFVPIEGPGSYDE